MTILMAHRGARNLWAENSAQGFRNVLGLGVRAVEFDLHLTDAGQVVVIHDPTLDRTTNATGPVRYLTDASRKALRLTGPEGEIAEGVPTLEEVLGILAPASNLALYPELKSDESGRPYEGLVERTVEILRRHGVAERSVLHSFDIEVVRRCARVAPEIPRLISLNAEWAEKQGGLEAFFASVRDLVEVVGVHHTLFEAEFDRLIALFPRERLGVWTLNDAALIRHWLAREPGYLTSDDPRLVLELMNERQPA